MRGVDHGCILCDHQRRGDPPGVESVTPGDRRSDLIDVDLPFYGGFVALPAKPGLGLELDEKLAKKHPYNAEAEGKNRANLMWPDGAMTDP